MTTIITNTEPPACVQVTPAQFKIELELEKEIFLDLHVTNLTDKLVTFKVKTTARDRYLLKPTQDYLPVGGSKTCKIVLSRLHSWPDASDPKALKDKFLVQAINIDKQVEDLTKFWKDLESQHNPKQSQYAYHETKIRCRLNIPLKTRVEQAGVRGAREEEEALKRQKDSSLTNPNSSSLDSSSSVPVDSPPVHHVSSSGPPVDQSGVMALLERKQKEYDELMEFVVKMTAQLEAIKEENNELEAKHEAFTAQIHSLNQTIEQLQSSSAAPSADESASGDTLRARRGANDTSETSDSDTSGDKKEPKDAKSKSSSLVSPTPPAPTKGMSLALWQVALFALVCFILGRIFS